MQLCSFHVVLFTMHTSGTADNVNMLPVERIHHPVEHKFVTETYQQTRAAGETALGERVEDLGT